MGVEVLCIQEVLQWSEDLGVKTKTSSLENALLSFNLLIFRDWIARQLFVLATLLEEP